MDRLHLPGSLIPGLLHLLRAYRYARDTSVDPWQFAVELDSLDGDGVTRTDLRWLLAKGYVQHQQEVTPPAASQRQFRPLTPTQWPENAGVILTHQGYLQLSAQLEPGANGAPPREPLDPAPVRVTAPQPPAPAVPAVGRVVPHWDPTLRELRHRGQVIKRFRVPAPNQELILNAFQAEGWPQWIEDPHTELDGVDPVQRLLATVKSLNRNQIAPLVTFHCQSNAAIVSWADQICDHDVR